MEYHIGADLKLDVAILHIVTKPHLKNKSNIYNVNGMNCG